MDTEFKKPYRLEFFQSDVGQIMHFIPVLQDGSVQPDAQEKWRGQATGMTPQGPINLQFELPGPGLAECITAWPLALQRCAEQFNSDARRRAIAGAAQQGINGSGINGSRLKLS